MILIPITLLSKSGPTLKDFSPAIIAWGSIYNKTTLKDFIDYEGFLSIQWKSVDDDLSGVEYMVNITSINFTKTEITHLPKLGSLKKVTSFVATRNTGLTAINIVGMSSLKDYNTYGCALESMDITGLTNLETFACNLNNITHITGIESATKLKTLYCHQNSISSIGNLSGLTSLERIYLFDNELSTASVDRILSELHTASEAGAPLASIRLQTNSVPTGGVNNQDYIYLTEQGIEVLIDI